MPEYEEKGISREEKVDLYQALDKLSPDYRKVLILRYFQDMKIKEIGEVMQIPEGTVKVMIHRGRKILQRILVEEMGYEESNV